VSARIKPEVSGEKDAAQRSPKGARAIGAGASTQQRGQTPTGKREQMRESASASNACGDGMADDALATRLQAAQEMGALGLQCDAERCLKEEGGGSDRAVTGGGFVANLYRGR
jgi:hypothetical protein